jgi:N-acetylneuraminate synthase
MRDWFARPNREVFVIAEVAQAHDGSLGTAHAYIDLAADCGANAVKFQTHIAAAESTPGEPWRVKFGTQDETRYAYWRRMEFQPAQWRELRDHARERKLVFLSTPFSNQAIDLLETLDMAAWKVGSGEVTNTPMLERLAGTHRPVLLSSGMATWAELDEALKVLRRGDVPIAVLQCTSSYPCPPERWGLNVIRALRERYPDAVTGFSDHSGEVFAGLAAVALGAELIEVHVTFSKRAFGPDVPASLDPDALSHLIQGARSIQTARRHPVDKDALADELGELKRTFEKSVVLARDLTAGHTLAADDLASKKPGSGIPAARLTDLVGKRLTRDLPADTLLAETDFQP